MTSLRFFHAADLHLDTPFKGLESQTPHMAAMLHESTFTALNRLAEACIARKADFLLIAGDIYNHEEGSLKAQFALRDACKKLDDAGIGVFIVHGNHDFAGSRISRMQWPDNVTIFDTGTVQTVSAVRDNTEIAVIHGISHATQNERANLARRFKRDETRAALPQIGLLHCTIASVAKADRYAPCSVEDLASVGLDYWALGHVHERQTVSRTPLTVYPGNIQGLHINESGPRGCYEVNYSEAEGFTLTFHQLGPVLWQHLNVSIDGVDTLDGLEAHIHDAISQCCAQAGAQQDADALADVTALMLRLELTGRGQLNQPLHAEGGTADLTERLRESWNDARPAVWIKDILLSCRPEADIEALRNGDDLLGETLRRISAARAALDGASQEEAAAEAVMDDLANGPLAPLFTNQQAKRLLDAPDADYLRELLDTVELTCLELLEAR
ncbi:metallophosphoesterase family protein [Oleidesulfovibrio sp.]|uniref:metallophosphoesterase family protein n=1 Tax=Oleidesulfovibrio sp. TaxID=2909707 RepID=UPI003A877E77